MGSRARDLKLSIWTTFYWEFGPEDALRHIASRGWGFVDFSAEHLGELYQGGSARRVEDVRRLMSELDVTPIQTHGLMQSVPDST